MRKCIGQYRPCLENIQLVTELETDMAGPARRDAVWDAALRALVSNPASIRLRDVQIYIDEKEVSDRTVRRTMNAMQALGWLEKDKEGGHYWFPGPKARQFLRVPGAGDHQQIVDDSRREVKTDAEPDIVEAGGAAAIEQKTDPISEVVATIDVHAKGTEMVRRRRDLLRAILHYIREEDEVSPTELRGKFYPEADVEGVMSDEVADSVGYGSEHSWWKNFVYPSLSEVGLVETGGEGSHTWFYVGEE